MIRSLIITVVTFLCVCVNNCCYADVDIPKNYWVKNRPNGYCFFCAAETVGKFYKIKQLYDFEDENGKHWGLMEWYAQWPSVGANDNDVHDSLTNLEVNYNVYYARDIEWLKKQTDNKTPVIVASSWVNGNHAYIVVDVEDKWVKIIDSNRVDKYRWLGKAWFEQNWNKWALIIHPKE